MQASAGRHDAHISSFVSPDSSWGLSGQALFQLLTWDRRACVGRGGGAPAAHMSPCTHGAYPVFEKYFNECLYKCAVRRRFAWGACCTGGKPDTLWYAELKPALLCGSARDVAGFAAGMLSIGAWLLAQMPQIISNFRNSSAEALSAWFLGEWLLVHACLG